MFGAPDDLRKNFADPPAEFRSMPLWVWNDQLEWPRLQEMLRQYKQQGMGGAFVHPRPGLMTEYLSADWFRLWRQSAEEAKRLGIQANIYDENSYPAGFAGGHVPSRAPDTVVQYIEGIFGSVGGGDAVASFAVKRKGATSVESTRRIERANQVARGETALVFRLKRQRGNPWTAQFPYVDLIDPETTRQFIATTYEPYKKMLGSEFGKTIKWAFNDEPHLQSGSRGEPSALTLPLSRYILAEFKKRCGYDLAGELPSLFWDTGEFQKVRFDYWQTMHDLWKENFFQPMYQWCDKNGIGFTGHWLEHSWPIPYTSPADGSMYAFEHMPGIDMLEGANLRTQGQDPHMLFTIKQVASVSHQLGRRAFCEAYGVAGYDSTFEHYKRFGDWLMVHGIDFIDQHLSYVTIRGARKRDHPQSFSDVSAWWPYYKLHGDHIGRVSYMLSRGEARNRVLLLVPTTSGFLYARKAEKTPELDTMRRENGDLIQQLADLQVDFDLGDEYMMEWYGKQAGRKFAIAKASYDLIVWPKNMANLRHETLPKLEAYLAAGGEIVALGPVAEFVDGRRSTKVSEMRRKYASQWRDISSADDIAKRVAPRVTFDRPLPQVGFSERILASGERIVFFANTGLNSARASVSLEGGSLERWDTVTGKPEPAVYEAGGGKIHFALDLAPAGSEMFVVKTAAAAPKKPETNVFTKVDIAKWKIEADSRNLLVLDYCDLGNTWKANWDIWQGHGFERPAWDNAVQFKTNVFDRNHFPKASGFDAEFRFDAADAGALKGLELAMEMPELYKVAVNGTPVNVASGERWMDPHIRAARIEAKVGENIVKISAHPFDVRMELENIYLRGNFSVVPAEKGFRIASPSVLDFGSWGKQGRPFYGDAVTYSAEVNSDGKLRVELGKFEASVIEILLDGKRTALLGWPPYAATFDAKPGKHMVALRVVSTPRNVFGPFHNRTKPRMRAWPAAWADFPERQPEGAKYDLLDYGLMEPPAILTAH